MIKAIVNGTTSFAINTAPEGLSCNGQAVQWSGLELPTGNYSVILDGRSYTAQVINIDKDAKKVKVLIEQQAYEVAIEEPIDQLLAAMGINQGATRKVNDIKAPMPGMVLKVLVSPGQEIKKGDPVLILEAMKMENVFKATADAIVKEIKVSERTAVEKGEVLVILE
ncbi:biotin/lipoyl-containing protein [Chitinophaga sancti]|uniref:biotin/lipoyl-containing protein n=1 Tax=Chitinophaga sancti TaxID=1004 RepID=UPI002A75D1B9|nr:biotin/lipoyl-containing protein [Chitinophaga sancti]WPQ64874.1 biotin/lipoyl-containing protein [Chitinophaga sancti]